MDGLFAAYSDALPRVHGVGRRARARGGRVAGAHARAVKAKALDLLRGLLPAASLSHMGIYATGQTYEQLILHLLAHPLPEARRCGRLILEAVQAVMPSFVSRVERPDRGGEWVAYLERARGGGAALGGAARGSTASERRRAARRCGWCTSTATRTRCWPRCCSRPRASPRRTTRAALAALRRGARASCWPTSSASARNRRHRPGRGFEALRYRFEIVSDYGAFRDLQRHRMLTVQWQALTPAPRRRASPRSSTPPASATRTARAWSVSPRRTSGCASAGLERAAPYALCLGYRIRYVLDLNAREAMQLIELRSGREGHPSYRAVAHEMHEQIARVHPAVAAAMRHVDTRTEPRLERILGEMRTQAKLDAHA